MATIKWPVICGQRVVAGQDSDGKWWAGEVYYGRLAGNVVA